MYAYLRNETINESLLMNKIVGRVADRSACNRKENRIKRALNGAIIHGNGGESARRNVQSGLRGVVMTVPWNTRMCRDTVSEAHQSQELRRPEFLGPLSFFPSLSSLLSLSLSLCELDMEFSLSRRVARRERTRA